MRSELLARLRHPSRYGPKRSPQCHPARAWLGRLQRDLGWIWGLRGLRPRVLWFHWRARRLAWRTNDLFSVTSVTRPADLRTLLELTNGCSRVVELGTATAWTAITLALDDRQ